MTLGLTESRKVVTMTKASITVAGLVLLGIASSVHAQGTIAWSTGYPKTGVPSMAICR